MCDIDIVSDLNHKKQTVKWIKGNDPFDNSARYTFEGRDPSYSLERFQVVIYVKKEPEYPYGPKKSYYYGCVQDTEKECKDITERYTKLKDAKQGTLDLFNLYMDKYQKEIN